MLKLIEGGKDMSLQGRLNQRSDEDKLYIYFDWKKGADVGIGAAAYTREGSAVEVDKLIEVYEDIDGENNYHHTLRAFVLALKLVAKLGIKYSKHKIVFLNQNELVFKWLVEGTSNADYEDLLMRADDLMIGLNYEEFAFKKCEGKANRAKKLLAVTKLMKATEERQLNLGNRLKATKKLKIASEE